MPRLARAVVPLKGVEHDPSGVVQSGFAPLRIRVHGCQRSVALVMIVVLVFLQGRRPKIIRIVAIPHR